VGASVNLCDFCATPHVRWVYMAASATAVGLVDGHGRLVLLTAFDDDRWRSCEGCSLLIDGKELAALVSRSLGLMRGKGVPVPQAPEALTLLKAVLAARFASVLDPGASKVRA
jgi:hypothetical protein